MVNKAEPGSPKMKILGLPLAP